MTFVKFFDVEGLSADIRKKAERELGEKEEIKLRSLKELKELIHAEPSFEPCMEEVFLLGFLRQKKFDVKRAFDHLKRHYIFKARNSGVLTDFKPCEVKEVLEECYFTFLEYRDGEGSAIGYLSHDRFDMKRFSVEEIFRVFSVFVDQLLNCEVTQITGIIVILDYTNFTFSTARHFMSPTLLYRLSSAAQEYMNCRVKAIHIVRQPFYYDLLFRVIRRVAPEKLLKRVHFHGNDMSSLYQHIPREILPEEVGGGQGAMRVFARECNRRIYMREERIATMNTFGFQGKSLKKRNSIIN